MSQPKQSPHGDYTGQQKARLAKEHADELAKRQNEISLINDAEKQFRETSTIDMTQQGGPIVLDGDEVVEVEGEDEIKESPHRVIRVNQDVEQMTVGAGTSYSFVAGQKYRVPVSIAEHLEEKNLVWH